MVVLVLVAGGAVGWATSAVFKGAPDVDIAEEHTFATVVSGEVGESIVLNVRAQWTRTPVGVNRAAGVVTEIYRQPGEPVEPGAVLYSVDLRPIVAAAGRVPAFRSLQLGVRGADVAQLQALLRDLELFAGEVDGFFGSATFTAVSAWQRDLGVARDGVVRAGDLVFVPTLPARIALDLQIVRLGATVVGGEAVVLGLSSQPTFSLSVTESQAARMPAGTAVLIDAPDAGQWQARVRAVVTNAEGAVTVSLEPAVGSAICGDVCGTVPVSGDTLLRSTVVTVPSVAGLTVPVAALTSDAEGVVAVIDEDGTALPVEVLASAGGVAVVDGVLEGIRVRVPANSGR